MINRFKITVAAAALLAGTSFANAQGAGQGAGMSREAPSGGSTMPQGAPSSDRGNSAGQMNRDAAEPGMKSTQSDEKSPAGRNQRADENMQGQKSKGVTSETDNNTKTGKDMKAEGRQDRDTNRNADSKGASDSKSQTTGQAGAGAKLSSEQRTKITTVIK